MNLTIDVPGVRGLGEAGEGVGSIDEDAAEVVSLTEDGSLAEDRAGVRNMAKDVPGVRGLGKAGAGVRVLEEAIDRLNPGLNLGLVLSNVTLSQELLEVGLMDKIKLKCLLRLCMLHYTCFFFWMNSTLASSPTPLQTKT